MEQLDKWNKEVERLSTSSFKKTSSELDNFYKQALKELKVEIKRYIEDYDKLSFSKKLEVESRIKTAAHIDDMLNWLNKETENSIRKHIETEIKHGYFGTWYALEGNEGIQIDFPLLDEDYIKRLVFNPVDGETFSKRLYDYRTKLGKTVTSELLNGAVAGQGYGIVAKNVAEQTEASYKQALRIARTEGGRVRSSTKQTAYRAAERQGIDLEKRWLATLDKKTRHSHQELDGQTVPVREKFIFNGYEANGPRLFGVASLDINCRCTTIAVVNGLAPEVRKDNMTKEVIDYKNYQEWYNDKVKEASKKTGINEQITSKISEKQYDFYANLLKSAPKEERDLWNKYQYDLRLHDNLNTNGGAYYMRDQGVTMNVNNDMKGASYSKPGNKFFHEFGHHIDFSSFDGPEGFSSIKHTVSNGKTLGKTVDDEVKRMISKRTGKILRKKAAMFKELKKDFDKDVSVMGSISDLYGGVTNNQLNVGIGHGDNYWKPPKSKTVKIDAKQYKYERLGKEAFAEMFAASVMDPEEVAMFEKWLPESYGMYKELINLLTKGG